VLGPGDQVGTWRLLEPLGVGGTGRVWLGASLRNPADRVAIKLVRPTSAGATADRFRREAECLERLKHPHIVGFRESGELREHGLLFLVMDLVEGRDLTEIIEEGPLDPEQARALFVGLADALRHAHTHYGICHRDLKPQNVIVRPDGTGCLIDFGIAVEEGAQRLTQEDVLPGTIGYLAPEIFRTGVSPEPRLADVYALGQMLYETLVGRYAFAVPAGMTGKQASARILREKAHQRALDPGPGIPDDLREVVRTATDPDPDMRYATMARLHRALSGAGHETLPAVRTADQNHDTVWGGDEDPETEDVDIIELPPGLHLSDDQLSVRRPRSFGSGSGAPVAPPKPPVFVAPAVVPPPYRPPSAGLQVDEDALPDFQPLHAAGVVDPPKRRRKRSVAPEEVADAAPAPAPEAVHPPSPVDTQRSARLKRLIAFGLAVGFIGSVAVALAVVVLLRSWGGLGGSTADTVEEPTGGAVAVAVTGEARLWLDGVERALTDGAVRVDALGPGVHAIVLAAGSGCEGSPPAEGSCCRLLTQEVSVVEGQEAPIALVAPVAPEPFGSLVVRLEGKPASAPQVWLGSAALTRAGREWKLPQAPAGKAMVRVDVGSCADAAGCSATSTCAPGCGSTVTEVDVPCGGTVEVPVPVPTPASSEAAPVPGAKPGARPRPKPEDDDVIVAEPLRPAQPTVGLYGEVTKGPLTLEGLNAAIGAKAGAVSACYDRFRDGRADMRREVIYSFRLRRNGTVEPESVERLKPSGETAVDNCVKTAVLGLEVTGSKRTGEGRVRGTFRAE
jgi:serine/threonine protein kinase